MDIDTQLKFFRSVIGEELCQRIKMENSIISVDSVTDYLIKNKIRVNGHKCGISKKND